MRALRPTSQVGRAPNGIGQLTSTR
jgi:hypothetical protein